MYIYFRSAAVEEPAESNAVKKVIKNILFHTDRPTKMAWIS